MTTREPVLGTTDFQGFTSVLYPETGFQATPTELVRDLEAMNALRRASTRSTGDAALYAQQLAVLSGKGVHRGPVAFTWGSVEKSTTSFSVAFERANVLIGLGERLLAKAVEAKQDAKAAAFDACAAAACFVEAFRVVQLGIEQGHADAAVPDYDGRVSEAAALAVAQAAFVAKAAAEAKSIAILSRLSKAAADLFKDANDSNAAALYEARACLYQAKVVAATSAVGSHGSQIAFLRHVVALLTRWDATKNSTGILTSWLSQSASTADTTVSPEFKAEVKDILDEAKPLLATAEKDNDIVYLEPIPCFDALPPIAAAKMVKPAVISVLSSYLTTPFVPLFSCIIPENLRIIQSKYAESLASLLIPFTELSDATKDCRSTLASLSLPQSIESLSKTNAQFLQDLRNTSSSSNVSFSSKSLDFQTSQLHTLRETCKSILSNAVAALDQEEAEDMDLRGPHAFGSRWNRLESRQLAGGLREAANSYFGKLDAARRSDDVVLQKVSTNYERICLLGSGDTEAMNLITLGGANTSLASSIPGGVERVEEVVKLKAVLNLLNEVIEKRTKLLESLDELKKKDDITPRLLETIEKNQLLDTASEISRELSKYDGHLKSCQESLKSQSDIMALVQTRNTKFVAWKQSQALLVKRDAFVTEYTTATNMYKEIMGNL
ncbi:UNVERIFIED_CONTAM: Rhophilin, Rho GTPase binding protein, partial [Siphonaria sp. JEL0065]